MSARTEAERIAELSLRKCARCGHRGALHQLAAPAGEQRCDCGCRQFVSLAVTA